MSADLWGIGDPKETVHAQTDTLMSDQTTQPLYAREALPIGLDTTTRERVSEHHE